MLHRLRQRNQIVRLYRSGKSFRGQQVVVRTFRTGEPFSRWAFSARREIGTAVQRNRVKRRMREAVRSLQVSAGWDVLLSAVSVPREARFAQLACEIENLLVKAGVVERTHA